MIYSYYALLERMWSLEYFTYKMNSNLLDVLNMENCILNGLPFWDINIKDEINKDIS
jgi:hypothetical protein